MNKGFLSSLLLMLLAAGDSSAHASDDYLQNVKADYSTVLLSRIISAQSIRTATGHPCFYSYTSEVAGVIRGKFQRTQLNFTSEAALVIGDEYIIYFSRPDALVKRYAPSAPAGPELDACRNKIEGFHLLGSELQHKTRFWNGRKFIDVVEFGDHLADIPGGYVTDQPVRYYDFNYLIDALSK